MLNFIKQLLYRYFVPSRTIVLCVFLLLLSSWAIYSLNPNSVWYALLIGVIGSSIVAIIIEMGNNGRNNIQRRQKMNDFICQLAEYDWRICYLENEVLPEQVRIYWGKDSIKRKDIDEDISRIAFWVGFKELYPLLLKSLNEFPELMRKREFKETQMIISFLNMDNIKIEPIEYDTSTPDKYTHAIADYYKNESSARKIFRVVKPRVEKLVRMERFEPIFDTREVLLDLMRAETFE